MPLRIEVDSTELDIIKFTDKKTQLPKEMRKQKFYWHKKGSKYPVEFDCTIDERALPIGYYNVDSDKLIDIDRFNSLSVNGFAVFEVISSSPYRADDKPFTKDDKPLNPVF